MPRPVPLELAMNFRGVNRRDDPQAMRADELYTAANFVPKTRGIAETRLGATRFNATAWENATAGRELIRYYPSGGTKRKVAAFNVAGGDQIVYGDDENGTLAEVTGATALTANKDWRFCVYLGNLYMGNATEAMQKSTDGTTRTDVTTLPIGHPACVYRSRLVIVKNPTQRKRVYYTGVESEECDTTFQYRSVEHPEDVEAAAGFGRDEDRGVFGDLAVFTATSTWIQRGDFGEVGEWDRATDRLGTLSPLSLVDTPYGLMGLGYDGTPDLVVFMIPVGGGRPIIVSDKIRGAEILPMAYRKLACAVYHDGFYKLSFVPEGGSAPTRQWWGDLRRLNPNADDYGIGWWGPHSGQTIGAFAVQADASDSNELIGVDGTAGYINNLEAANTYTDFDTAYTAIIETKSMDGKDPLYLKTFDGYIVGCLATQQETLATNVKVDEGSVASTQDLSVGTTAVLVGDTTYVGDVEVGGEYFEENVDWLASPLYGRRASIEVQFSAGRQLKIKRLVPIARKTARLTV